MSASNNSEGGTLERKLRILLVLDSYPPDLNGGAYFTHRLALALDKAGHEVLSFGPSLNLRSGMDRYEGVSVHRFSSLGTPLYRDFRMINPIGLRQRVSEALSDFAPDVIHIQGKFLLGGTVFREASSRGIPMIATNHLMPGNFAHHFRIPRSLNEVYESWVWGRVFEMLNHVPIVTCPTESGIQAMRRAGFEGAVEAVSCGIDHGRFFPGEPASGFRERFGVPEGPVLISTGRLDKEKNLDLVLRAVRSALDRVEFTFLVTGDGAERQTLGSLAEELGIAKHVRFVGVLTDGELPEAYRVADAYVNASELELQSICGLEAISSGLPVVLADALALPELVCRENPNGFLFPPGDEAALASLLVKVLQDPALREELGANSLTLAKRHFIENVCDRYIELYREAIESGAP